MIVIYNNDFLEKLRRPSNIVTIGSFSLNYISREQVSSHSVEEFTENLIKQEGTQYVKGYDILGTWDDRKQMFRLRFDFPEDYISSPQTRGLYQNSSGGIDLESIFTYTAIRFYEDTDELAFVVIGDTLMTPLNSLFSQTRNLLNIRFPEDALARIETINKSDDLKFLGGYGVDLGENIYKVDENGNIMVTNDTFFKMFSRKLSEMDVEAIPFVRNDNPFLDADGKKTNNHYTYRIYKSLNIYCSGLEHDCWMPTKYDLYKNYLDGGVKLYGTAEYDEYAVFGNYSNRVASGVETIENIPGLEFEEIENSSLEYTIDYNNNKFIYIKPEGEESEVNKNAYVILRACICNYNGTTLVSNKIRFYQGGRDDEWKVLNKSTDYSEPVDGKDIPVFLFPWDNSDFKHTIEISTTLKVNKKEDINLVLENSLLGKYFDVTWKIKKLYDVLGNFDRTRISVTLVAKTKNTSRTKWNPLNEKGESELMLASLEYNHFKTSFYMVQSPKVLGLRLYEFNSLGGSFTAVKKIELEAAEKSKTYWMMTEEKTAPVVRPWWTSYTSSKNKSRGIKVESQEYLKKRSYIEKKADEIITYPIPPEETPGYGKFTVVPKAAFRPDVEITGKSSSMYIPTDQEMFKGMKYMTVFDSFSIDDNGYITLNSVKVVSTSGLVQADSNAGKNIQVGSNLVLDQELTPITRTLSTYVNSTALGKDVPGIAYKSATSNNSGNYIVDSKGNIINKSNNSLETLTTASGTSSQKTTVTTDGKLVDNLTMNSDVYYMTDAKVVSSYINDRETTSVTSLTTAVTKASLDTEQTLNDTIQENTTDQVIAFIKEDGTIGYTSKEEGIAVKLITDDEGKLVMDPRKAWDNRRLRPVIVHIKEDPIDVRDIEDTDNPFDPITFFRVDEDEIRMFEDGNEGKYPKPTWRNMVRRAQVTYAVNKKGQDPFIQIIGSERLNDRKIKVYENGRFVTKIKHAPSSDLKISYIKRNSVIVRSNCPFKLSIKYNKGFEETLTFDTYTREMKSYTVSNDGQTMYCKTGYNAKYGRGVYINSLEADDTGNVGKLIASYNDLTESSNIIAEDFSTYKEVAATDKNGVVNNDILSRVVLLNPGKASTVYVKSRRTLRLGYMSTKDTVTYKNGDQEPIRISTPSNHRVPINYSGKNTPRLRISKVSPVYDIEGYVTHSTTMDVESSRPKYPISPVGVVDVIPYQGKNREKFYVYEKGVKPDIRVTSYPGALGPNAMKLPDDPTLDPSNFVYSSVTYDSETYKLSKWDIEKEKPQDRALEAYVSVSGNGDIKMVPIRWVNQHTGEIKYSLPGTILHSTQTSPYYRLDYTPNTSSIAYDTELYTGVDNPVLWAQVNKDMFRYQDDESIFVAKSNRHGFVGDKFNSSTKIATINNCKVSRKSSGYNLTGNSLYTAKFPENQGETKVDGQDYSFNYFKLDASGSTPPVSRSFKRTVNIVSGRFVNTLEANFIKFKRGGSKDMFIELTPELLSAIDYKDPKTGQATTKLPKFAYRKITGADVKDIKTLPPGTVSCETTFSLESEYKLQYVRITGGDGKYKIVSTPTKLYYDYLNKENPSGLDSVFDAVNIQRLKSSISTIFGGTDTVNQGDKNTRIYDVDIIVNPVTTKVDGKTIPLFKITYITEEYKNGKWKYNITVIPTNDYDNNIRRYCGSIQITSRIRGVLDNSSVVPQKILESYPRVLPLLNGANKSVRGETRPLKGSGKGIAVWPTQASYDFRYEETILPDEQGKLDAIVQPVSVSVDIYQQKNNIILLVGNRSGSGNVGQSEVYTTSYEPGKVYNNVTLSPKTIRLHYDSLGWVPIEPIDNYKISDAQTIEDIADHWPALSGDIIMIDSQPYKYNGSSWTKVYSRGKYNYKLSDGETLQDAQIALTKKPEIGTIAKVTTTTGVSTYYEFSGDNDVIVPAVNNYDPAYSNTSGSVNGKSYQYPFIEVKFNDPLSTYKPSTPELMCGGIRSDYSDSTALNESLRMSIDVGNWVDKGGSSTIDDGEYYIKTSEDFFIGSIKYYYWDRYENGELSNFFRLLLPEFIKVNSDGTIEPAATGTDLITYMSSSSNLSIDKPLPSNCMLFVNSDNDIDDNYLINTKHKYIVSYDSSTGKLYNSTSMDSRWVWETVESSVYSETIPFKLPSITTGLVCATSKNGLKLYLGENSKRNVITESVTGKSTYVDLFAGEFRISTDDSIIRNLDTSVYFAKKDDTPEEIGGINYYRWYKYVDDIASQKYYLLIRTDRDLSNLSPSNPLIPDYTVFIQSGVRTPGFAGEDDKILVYRKMVSEDLWSFSEKEHLYMYDRGCTGNTNFSIRKADSLTSDWSFEILSETVKLENNVTPENNIRITFPPNETEDSITRIFKITTLPENGETEHEITVKVVQGSYLGSINCDDTIRFNPDGTYFSGDPEDPYFYFDTDIPGSELEFEIPDDYLASAYLSVGDDINSAYGIDFKKYRLSIKLDANKKLSRESKHLVIYRTYNMYDPKTGKLTPKKKEIRKVKLDQGYEAVYLSNPVYNQDVITGNLDVDFPTPDTLYSGMISGSFYNPLKVPKDKSVTKLGQMDFTMVMGYTKCVPSEFGGWSTTTIDGDDLVTFLSQKDEQGKDIYKLSYNWVINSGEATPDLVFEEGYKTLLATDGPKNLNYPYIYHNYEVKEEFINVELDIYVTTTFTLLGKEYKFYSYLKKLKKNLNY